MSRDRSPGLKFLFVMIVSAMLVIPLVSVYLLVYDRQNQSSEARASIAQGWGGPQLLAGPLLVIPYKADTTETTTVDGKPVTRTVTADRELFIAPDKLELDTAIAPQARRRSIYEAVVYDAAIAGRARYSMPADLSRLGIDPAKIDLTKAELRFGVSDARGLRTDARVMIGGRPVAPLPGNGLDATNGSGFHAEFDSTALTAGPLPVQFRFSLRGNSSLTVVPRAGETLWTATSAWPSPSFTGGFLPDERSVGASGFRAVYRISNLALGTALAGTDTTDDKPGDGPVRIAGDDDSNARPSIALIQPVDLYSQVNRSVKYGFLFIGFTFMAFFLFDVVGGVRVSPVEYLLVGAGLVLFFVMLLAFAEVIGFTLAYLAAGGAIIGLLTAYSAAVLRSRRRAGYIAALLVALYAVLYVLLSLEEYSLLIGSLLLFAALACVMYLTRHLDWAGVSAASQHANSDGTDNG